MAGQDVGANASANVEGSDQGDACPALTRALASTVDEGGMVSDAQAADFLFSCDASHPDTLRIYQSLEYIEDNATVFHAYYLSAVANTEMKNSVALGHFVLPPACLQKDIRRKIGSFIWEEDENFLIEKCRGSFYKDSSCRKADVLPSSELSSEQHGNRLYIN